MTTLSLPIERLKPRYDVVVIGSGYGGGIAASRLARAGKTVCVLERGRELQPGQYPRTELELTREVQMAAGPIRVGARTALFDLRFNKDINVIIGCGLGGTSLINAGIALRPDPRVFEDSLWPVEIRSDAPLDRYFRRAEDMLKPAVYPDKYPRLNRLEAITECAQPLKAGTRRVPVLVNFDELANGVNHASVPQRACVGCGDCVTGCNYSAKNTVLMNYLPDARNHGAELFTEIEARHVEHDGVAWRVVCETTRADTARREIAVTAGISVLAAGALGSTEILLRSREMGLRVSDALGTRFSGNGDTIGFAYNCDRPINGVGFGALEPGEADPVGACSTTMLDLRSNRALDEGMVIVDGTIPGGVSKLLAPMLAAGARLTGEDTDRGIGDKLQEWTRELASKLAGPRVGAVRNTLFMLAVGHDDAGGKMHLEHDRLYIAWPGIGAQQHFTQASQTMRAAAAALGGTYIPNPVWNALTNHNLITGHPLGGCAMADSATLGVVNHKGQVYRGDAPDAVHEGLYVMDGAVIPRSLGVNPLLTISALAERSCEHMVQNYS
jgi:cholesterol oxidase